RHPAVTVNAIATLHEMSGGRARLAVGAGDRPVTELGHRPAPVATVREMIAVARALTAGGEVSRRGPITLEGARLTARLPSPLPVYVAASCARMLAPGGEAADGVLFFSGVHAPCVAWALARIAGSATLWRRRLKDLVALGVRHLNVFVLSRDQRGMLEALARDVLPAVRGIA